MSRLVMVVLLVATGVVLAGDRPAAGQDVGARPQTQTGDAQTGSDPAQQPTDAPQTPEDGAQSAEAPAETGDGATVIAVPGGSALGMSILGNQEAPTSLVIVPWKTSELGDTLGIAPMLDDSRQPVDKDVFMRALRYYEIRSGAKP